MDLQNVQSKALKCPRCDSFHTKFCYYINYNYSQPRHFCKSCRRYWTIGGVLRNVPAGGGTRKSKKSKPKPPTPIVRDSPSSNSISDVLSPSRLLTATGTRPAVEDSRSSVPFAADWYGWRAEKRARGEGFGTVNLSRSEGMVEICSAVY